MSIASRSIGHDNRLKVKIQKICLNRFRQKHSRTLRDGILFFVIKKNHTEKNKRHSIMRIF